MSTKFYVGIVGTARFKNILYRVLLPSKFIYYTFVVKIHKGRSRMNTKKLVIVCAVVAIIVVAAATVAVMNSGSEKKAGGLYGLDAQVISVELGGITATPKMVSSIESLYEQVYGSYDKAGYTIEDVKNDSEFWKEYCDYSPVVKVNGDGSFTLKISTAGITREVTLDTAADTILSTGTMYMTTIYYFLCLKYGEEPYSNEALENADLKNEFQKVVAGGISLAYVENNTELIEYFDPSTYLDSGQNTIANYEIETIGQNVKDLVKDERKVILLAAGRTVDDTAYNSIRNTLKANGGMEPLFISLSDIKGAFANIECIGHILGYGEYVDELIEDLQVRLYEVYRALQAQNDTHKVYWENAYSKAVSASGMSASIMGFFGWDTSLMTGSETDLEKLYQEQPDIIIFYSNDTRSMDEKMRA